ncbi:hypothetical protein G6O69_23385 [Pseudenhygromyxa sp. WMMC2535]|uniref:hypothetical protein n=1 Tax=Pseudenhygromyxa sp. WMMC2535 TaxID=2712867 RepID=UPI001558232C|nr:hypothetical protein [Pseudenhygromyxa sp. WMMC2535]NVB40803.1 hypothetical protein [Pseudenhygromyxa sp. WMMC2535]
MNYNFTDEAQPALSTLIDPTGALELEDGDVQGNLITDAFSGSAISVSIQPPSGWSLDSVTWVGGGSGTFLVPDPGTETSHRFTYTVTRDEDSLSSSGSFKIKRQSGTGG